MPVRSYNVNVSPVPEATKLKFSLDMSAAPGLKDDLEILLIECNDQYVDLPSLAWESSQDEAVQVVTGTFPSPIGEFSGEPFASIVLAVPSVHSDVLVTQVELV